MTESRKVVKVFLASPGDLADERKAAKAVVDEFNAQFADEFGYQVELVGWEDTVSVYGRPQAIINRELERCEFFVGLMWKKWGTSPDTTGTYSSGFEEEFETTVQRRSLEGRPEISLLFKEIDPEFLRDPGEDLKRVLAFKEKLITNKTILFESFVDIRELEKKFRRCITTYILELRNREAEAISAQNQAPNNLAEKQPADEESSIVPETPLSTEGVIFLREFTSKTARDAGKNLISAAEVARFRLLANIVGVGGMMGDHSACMTQTYFIPKVKILSLGVMNLLDFLPVGLNITRRRTHHFGDGLQKLQGLLPQFSQFILSSAPLLNARWGQ